MILYLTIFKFFLILLFFIFPLAGFLAILEKLWSATIQDRIGPSIKPGVSKIRHFFYPLANSIKSIITENHIPKKTDYFLYNLAPLLYLLSGVILITIIPFTSPLSIFQLQIFSIKNDLLIIMVLLLIGYYGSLLGQSSLNRVYSQLASLRALALLISYTITIIVILWGIFIVYGEMSLTTIVLEQQKYWFNGIFPKWGIFTQPITFILFFPIMMLVTFSNPFNSITNSNEIFNGYLYEYSGIRYQLFYLAQYINKLGFTCLAVCLFLGGDHIPWLPKDFLSPKLIIFFQLLSFFIKMIFIFWLQIILTYSFPKLSLDQIIHLLWCKILPIGFVNAIITAIICIFF